MLAILSLPPFFLPLPFYLLCSHFLHLPFSPSSIPLPFLLPLSAYLQIPSPQFKLLLDAVVWAFKHTMRNVADIGLNILFTLLQKFANHEAGAQFFQTYFLDLMQHIFSVVTDTSHTASVYRKCVCSSGLGPRPKTHPSADCFQYRTLYWKRYMRRMRSGDETNTVHTVKQSIFV